MISTGPHPTFHGGAWPPRLDELVSRSEPDVVAALNEVDEWVYVLSAVVIVDTRPAFIFSKRQQMPLSEEARLNEILMMVDEVKLQAALNKIIVGGDPHAYWSAGWAFAGGMQ